MYYSWDSNILSPFLMIITPKITLASPMSFISKLDPRNNLVLETISMHVPNINMSSTYKHIMTHSPFFRFRIQTLWVAAKANKTQIEEILVIGAKVSK